MTVRARPLFRERTPTVRVVFVEIDEIRDDQAFGQFQRRLDGIGEPLADAVLDD